MCYYLYGNINKEAYNESFYAICDHFQVPYSKLPDSELLFQSDLKNGVFFRLTSDYCDCKTPLGSHKTGGCQLERYMNWIRELKACKHIKYVALLKYWEGADKKAVLNPTKVLHVDEIDTKLLSDIEDDTFYKIQLFQRFY